MRGSAAVLAAIVLQACAVKKESTIDYSHPNGLSLKLPAALSAHQLGDGFVVQLAASLQDRAPAQVLVTLRRSASRPAGEWLERKSAAGRLFHFRLDREEGGSGGAGHKLTAWCPHADGFVLIVQVAQAEWPAVADHSLAWMVMDAVSEPPAPDVK